MNFLAHLYLSDGFEEEMVGNLMADFVTGRIDTRLPAGIQHGIWLHRQIDTFTDAHPVVRQAKHRLFATYRHYAAVIMDVFYDHFLAAGWPAYHAQSLDAFAARAYQVLNAHQQWLPPSMQPVLAAMQRQNWLVQYAAVDGIDRALTQMARRTKFVSGMETATDALTADYEWYQANFHTFFPDLVTYVAQVRNA